MYAKAKKKCCKKQVGEHAGCPGLSADVLQCVASVCDRKKGVNGRERERKVTTKKEQEGRGKEG